MGDPKKPRKKYKRRLEAWNKEILQKELELIGIYGLRNKRELWRAEAEIRRIRREAKSLFKLPEDKRKAELAKIVNKLYRLGLVEKDATIDTILGLETKDWLERRLQTIVLRKGLAKTIYQARQLITHGHIAINGRRVTCPGYIVKRDEEDAISYYIGSPFYKRGGT